MKKFLIGALIVCLSLGLTGMAMAADVSWSGSVDLGIEGTSAEGEASGNFFGDWELNVEGTATSGPWSATVAMENFEIDDAYLMYSADAYDLTLDADGIDNDIYDIECAAEDVTLGIPSRAGLQLDLPMETFDFYAIVNNTAVGDEIKYNFAGGVDFAMDALGLGLTFNSDGENETSSYGAQVTYTMGALSLTGQYGSFSPDEGDAGSGYAGMLTYTLAGGSAFTLEYYGADETLNSADGVTRDAYSSIYGEFTTPIAESVDLYIDMTSTDSGENDTVTEWEAYVEFSI